PNVSWAGSRRLRKTQTRRTEALLTFDLLLSFSYLPINLQHLLSCTLPTILRHVNSTRLDELRAERRVQENLFDTARDIEYVLRIDQHGGVSDHLRQRARRGRDYRRARGHRFQRRKSEAFVERGEDERRGRFVEDAHRVEGDETEEPHGIFHPALHDGLPHRRIAGDFIADDNQAQILVLR